MLTVTKPQVQLSPRPLVRSYVPQTYTFKVILRDRLDQENLVVVSTDSDRVCNVLAVIQAQYPGQGLVDLWEVAG